MLCTACFLFCFLALPALFKSESKFANESTKFPADLPELLQNEDIKNTWHEQFLSACLQRNNPSPNPSLNCFFRPLGYERVRVELLSLRPAILRVARFLSDPILSKIATKVRISRDVQSQGVEGLAYSEGHRGRRADGLWMLHHESEIRPFYRRIREVLTLNPAIGEDFLVLKYAPFGHYAPHYDHLDPMPPSYDDGWFAFFGNRLATALLLVETANRGGSTVFPKLALNIMPEKGDLLLWMNADSNDRREEDALHAACPIVAGEKIAVSLWIRGNYQDTLKCSLSHPGYEAEELVRREVRSPIEERGQLEERPDIPRWVIEHEY